MGDTLDFRPVRKLHRLPIEAYASATDVYYFTVCARHLTNPFADPSLAAEVVGSLMWTRDRHDWFLPCYCLMPDHLHFIAKLQREAVMMNAGALGIVPEGILEHIRQFKRYTTRVWWQHGGSGSLWQRSSYDHVFRYGESVEEAISYVLMNPVRKGLVSNWEDYPYARIVDPWL